MLHPFRIDGLWRENDKKPIATQIYTTMNSQTHGKTTSKLEVTNISSHGIWLFSNGEEFFLSYQDFPWFKEAPVGKILHVEEPDNE